MGALFVSGFQRKVVVSRKRQASVFPKGVSLRSSAQLKVLEEGFWPWEVVSRVLTTHEVEGHESCRCP